MIEPLKTLLISILYILLAFSVQILTAVLYEIILATYWLTNNKSSILNLPYKLNALFNENIIYIILISSIITFISITIIYYLHKKKITKEFFLIKTNKINLIISVFLGFSILCVNIGFLGFLKLSGSFSNSFISWVQSNNFLTSKSLFETILIVGIIIPIMEELFFRGVIYTTLLKSFSILPSIFIQAILFGICHGNTIQFFYTTFLGLALGYLIYKSKSIFPAIFAHITNNILALIAFNILPKSSDTILTYTLFLVIGIPLIYLLFIALNKSNDTHLKMEYIPFQNL